MLSNVSHMMMSLFLTFNELRPILNSYFEKILMCSENKNDWMYGKFNVSCTWHTCTCMFVYVYSLDIHKLLQNYHILINHILKICEYASSVHWLYMS